MVAYWDGQKFTDAKGNPVIPDQIKTKEDAISEAIREGQTPTTPPSPGGEPVMTKEFDDGKGGKITGYSHDGGKTWGPQ